MNIKDYTDTELKKILEALEVVDTHHGLFTSQCLFRMECREEQDRRILLYGGTI